MIEGWIEPAKDGSHVGGDSYYLICICGNEPIYDGFFSVVGDKEVEPELGGEWDDRTYFCARCLRLIDCETLKVTGRLDSVTTLEGDILTRGTDA